jgi:hypothetical protein
MRSLKLRLKDARGLSGFADPSGFAFCSGRYHIDAGKGL